MIFGLGRGGPSLTMEPVGQSRLDGWSGCFWTLRGNEPGQEKNPHEHWEETRG